MLLLATDEDVHEDIVRGLRRREPALDLVRVVDVGLGHTPDPFMLSCTSLYDLSTETLSVQAIEAYCSPFRRRSERGLVASANFGPQVFCDIAHLLHATAIAYRSSGSGRTRGRHLGLR